MTCQFTAGGQRATTLLTPKLLLVLLGLILLMFGVVAVFFIPQLMGEDDPAQMK